MITRKENRMPVTVTGVVELIETSRVLIRSDSGTSEWIDTDDVVAVHRMDDQLPFPNHKEQ